MDGKLFFKTDAHQLKASTVISDTRFRKEVKKPTSELNSSCDNTEDISSFLQIPLKFLFYSCCCPFYISTRKWKVGGHTTYKKKVWWPQKIFCATLTILDIFWMVYLIRISLPQSGNNPAMYIAMFSTIASHVGKMILIWKLWRDEQLFENLANRISQMRPHFADKRQGKLAGKTKQIIWAICIVFTTIGLITVGRAPTVIANREALDGYLLRWWESMVDRGYQIFLFANETTFETAPQYIHTCVGILATLGFCQR